MTTSPSVLAPSAADAEAKKNFLVRQGWTPADFASQLETMLCGRSGKSLAVGFLPDGSMEVGDTTFDRTEAGYFVAFAGNLLSRTVGRPVGVTDTNGKRWLLSSTLMRIRLTRQRITYFLRAKQIKQAWDTLLPR